MGSLRRAIDWGLIVVGVVVLATFPPILGGDGVLRFDAVQRFATTQDLSDMRYSFIGPFFSVPLWFLGNVFKTPDFWVLRYNLILFLLGLASFWLLLRNRLDGDLIRKFLLLLIAASMFGAHTTQFYGEIFTAVLAAVGILAAVVLKKGTAAGWSALVVGVANTPAAIGGLVLVTLKRCFDAKRLRYLLAVPVAMGLIMAETYVRRQELFVGEYSIDKGFQSVLPYSGLPGFSYPFFFGLLAILLSFGKGLAFFAPGLLLPVRNRLREAGEEIWTVYATWLAFLVGLILVYARWWSWYGGFFWGPRFFLFASVPACLALAVAVHRPSARTLPNLFTAAVVVLSGWVAISSAVYGQVNLDVCYENSYALEHLCWYVPEFSVLWRPFVVAKALTTQDIYFMVFTAAVVVRMLVPLAGPVFSGIKESASAARARYLPLRDWTV